MTNYVIRIFDNNIKTNYIERLFEAEDSLDALEKIKSDSDVLREAKLKLSSNKSIERLIDHGCFELIEV